MFEEDPILSHNYPAETVEDNHQQKFEEYGDEREANSPTLESAGGELETPEVPSQEGEEEVVVCQLHSHSMFSVSVGLDSITVRAIVDTAAEVTIISDKVYNSLNPKPPRVKSVTLNTAGRNMKMQGIIAGPVEITLGSQAFKENIYVAPIADTMLLGIDFLRRHQVDIHINESRLVLGTEQIPMQFGAGNKSKVAKVSIPKTTVIPPNTVKRVLCKMSEPLEEFLFEPSQDLTSEVLMLRTVHGPGEEAELYIINPTDHNVRFKGGHNIGNAAEVVSVMAMPSAPAEEGKHVDEAEVPEHLCDLFSRSAGDLQQDETDELKSLLNEYKDVFAADEYDLGNFTLIEHKIDTGNAPPIKQKLRRTPMSFAEEEKAHLDRMHTAGVIQPSNSEWASAPVLIRKRDGNVRWCVDYRKLNAITRKDVYPLPNIEECLDTLAGNIWFSKLDANSAYWQVKVNEDDRKKTAFVTKYGLYEFARMGFGLCNAPATFSRVMNLVLRGLNWDIVLAFLDDVVVLGRSFSDHIGHLRQVLQRFNDYQLKLKPRKCVLFQRKVEFLGRDIDQNGMQLKDEHVKAVRDWPVPQNTKQVEQFLGLVNYHRAFIKDHALVAAPLYSITGKNKFAWTVVQQQAFEDIKKLLTSAPVLALPNATDSFILDTDASNIAIGAELIQVQDGQERVVAYGSVSLSPEQRRYCVTRRELLAVVKFTRQYRHYLLGKPFLIRTDHSSLTWLLSFKEPQGQIARWLEELSQFDMTVEHRSGKRHSNADALSRIPESAGVCEDYRFGFRPEDLPCHGCNYCRKAHQNWAQFVDIVDDVVPLAVRPKQMSATLFDDPPEFDCNITGVDILNVEEGLLFSMDGDDSLDVLISVVTAESDDSLPDETLQVEQEKDEQLIHLRHWLTTGQEPSEGTIMLWGPIQKKLWINRDLFRIDGGTLWKKTEDKDLLVVPRALQTQVMTLNHDLPSAGHAGMDRTIARIKSKYYWCRMTKDIKGYIASCSVCNQNKKATKHPRCPMTECHAGMPMEKVHLDFLGPLPKTSHGNEYILVMVDQFTKWVECVPLPSQTAEATAQAAVSGLFSRFGYPLQIVTDQGRNFESKLFSNLCKVLQIHKARTTPYRPSANGQVERYNRTLMDAVRCYIGKSQNQWDKYLSQIAGAIRSTVNRSTGFTPNMLMLGREINQPADLMFPLPTSAKKVDSVDDYCSNLAQAISEAHETARVTLRSTQKRMKRDYDVKVRKWDYQVGNWVYILDTASIKGKCRKLSPPWKGPALITKKLSPYLYRVEYKNTIFTVNHDRLKRCKDRKTPGQGKEQGHPSKEALLLQKNR